MSTAAEQGVITQVQLPSNELSVELPKSFILDLRGHRLQVDRDRLLSLPESILYSLSGGIVWDSANERPSWSSGSSVKQDGLDNGSEDSPLGPDGETLDVVAVDLNADLFEFVLNFFAAADHNLDPPTIPIEAFRAEVEAGLPDPLEDNEITAPVLDSEVASFEARDHREKQREKQREKMGTEHKDPPKLVLATGSEHLPRLPQLPQLPQLPHFHHHHNSDDHKKEAKTAKHSHGHDPNETQGSLEHIENDHDSNRYQIPEILQKRPSIISLREDLEYYCLLPSGFKKGSTPEENRILMEDIKLKAGDLLTKSNYLFGGLKDKDRLDSPEYHLVQMLCLAGLSPDTSWSYRRREPCRTSIVSMQLLNIDAPKHTGIASNDPSLVEALQKLLLFWRKPAKKCWWDRFDLDIPGECTIGIHARRVWTLEMSILGVD